MGDCGAGSWHPEASWPRTTMTHGRSRHDHPAPGIGHHADIAVLPAGSNTSSVPTVGAPWEPNAGRDIGGSGSGSGGSSYGGSGSYGGDNRAAVPPAYTMPVAHSPSSLQAPQQPLGPAPVPAAVPAPPSASPGSAGGASTPVPQQESAPGDASPAPEGCAVVIADWCVGVRLCGPGKGQELGSCQVNGGAQALHTPAYSAVYLVT